MIPQFGYVNKGYILGLCKCRAARIVQIGLSVKGFEMAVKCEVKVMLLANVPTRLLKSAWAQVRSKEVRAAALAFLGDE